MLILIVLVIVEQLRFIKPVVRFQYNIVSHSCRSVMVGLVYDMMSSKCRKMLDTNFTQER